MKLKVLIVEDEARSRMLARDILASQGFETLEASNAEDALKLAAVHQPALVIMDIRLPGQDGISALKALQASARTRAIPAICVTASAMHDEKETLLGAGFAAYLAKPFHYNDLVTVVRDVLKLED